MSITAIELASMRDEAETLMPDSCAVLRPTEVPDGQGGWTQTWATAGTYACNLATGPYMRFSAERVAAGQVTPVGIVGISLPHDADVNPDDRIVWTPAGEVTARMTIEVTQFGSRSWAINSRAMGKEVGDAA